MVKELAIIKILEKQYMAILQMVKWKAKDSYIFQVEIIIQGNSNLIKRKGEEHTFGLDRKKIIMKANLDLEKGMEEELFGGQMEAGMKDNLRKVFKKVLVLFLGEITLNNIKEGGKKELLMDKVNNISKMDKDMKVNSNKISLMAKEFSIKMIRQSTEFGETMS